MSLRFQLSPTLVLKWSGHSCVRFICSTSNTYHVQHVVYHAVQRDSPANKFERVELAFILALFRWLNLSINQEVEENGVPAEHPNDKLKKM